MGGGNAFRNDFFLKEVFSSLSLFLVVAVKAKYAETDPNTVFRFLITFLLFPSDIFEVKAPVFPIFAPRI